jgi:DNA topoisomerase-1
MKYNGVQVALTPVQEELATMYAAIPKDGPQLGNPVTARVFNKNFWREFQLVLGKDHPIIQSFELCDFSPIAHHIAQLREVKKAASKEEKDKGKEDKQAITLKYGFALVDNHLEKMGNYNIEPPGLFRGRGEHPKMGSLKKRVQPEDITLNVGTSSLVPSCPLPGHAWKRVIHDPTVTWLAYWKESVMQGTKYVFLAASSSFKGKSDLSKYEKARKLKRYIDSIRIHYEKLLKSSEAYERQSGTAMWIIDRLALRVGGEKDEDEADTVGCCSLRVEHISFPSDHEITLDFLGKDSMQYLQTIDLMRYGEIGAIVYKNLRSFAGYHSGSSVSSKKKTEDLFDHLSPARLNEQLNKLMPGLSAKVFRTYNASITLEKELDKTMSPLAKNEEKVLEYNRANREVAILCNHQRTVSKSFNAAWEKLVAKEQLLLQQLDELRSFVVPISQHKPIRLKSEDAQKGEKVKLPALSAAAAAAAAAAAVAPETPDERLHRLAMEESHLWAKQPDALSVTKRIRAWEDKLEKLQSDMRNKDENKNVALGTSKINYMDPRISVAWCKKVELPIEKVFPKTLLAKFPWAMSVPSTFTF